MKRYVVNVWKILVAGIIVALVTSCPSPITNSLVSAVEDSFDPTIIVTSPEYGSAYHSTVAITGKIMDNAIFMGDAKGSISRLSFVAGSLNIYRGGIDIDTEGNVSINPKKGDVPIKFDQKTGIFSFEVNMVLFRGPMQIEIAAADRNKNVGTTTFLLYESSGPIMNLTSPAKPLYSNGKGLTIAGTVGNSLINSDSITELSRLECTIPILGIYGKNAIILDIAKEFKKSDSKITYHSDRLGGFDFELDKATGIFTSDILIPGSVDTPINIYIKISDKNDHKNEITQLLIRDTGKVLLNLNQPKTGEYYSPTATKLLKIVGTIDADAETVASLILEIKSKNSAVIKKNITRMYNSATGKIDATVDLTTTPPSGDANCTITATTLNKAEASVSFKLLEDKDAPIVDVLSFIAEKSGKVYAHGGDTVILTFTIKDDGSGVDDESLYVTIGGKDVTPQYDEASQTYKARYVLPGQNKSAPSYNDKSIPFSVKIKDVIQNERTVNQTDTTSITYYHKAPDSLAITLDNPDNTNPRVANGQKINVSISTTRQLDSPAIKMITGDKKSYSLSLADKGGSYEGSFIIDSTIHSEGIIGYKFEYKDLAGNTGTFKNNATLMNVDYTQPALSEYQLISTSGENWASTSDSLKVFFVLNDNIDGKALDGSKHSPKVTFIDSGKKDHQVIPIYSAGKWIATLPVRINKIKQGPVTARVDIEDLAGNKGSITHGQKIIVDTTGPEIRDIEFTTNGNSSKWAKKGEKIFLSFTLYDEVEGVLTGITGELTAPKIILTQASGELFPLTAIWHNNRWKVEYTVLQKSPQGKVGYVINAVDIKNLKTFDSNASLSYGSSSVIIDTTLPVISIDTVKTHHDVTGYVGQEEITVHFTVIEENAKTPTVFYGGKQGLTVNTPGDTWESNYTVASSTAEGLLDIVITSTDEAGNRSSATNSSLTVDQTRPDIVNLDLNSTNIVRSKAKNGDLITIGFDVTDTQVLKASDFKVTTTGGNTVRTLVKKTGNHWSASYTLKEAVDTSGTFTVTVTATDPVGNVNTSSVNMEFDNEKPDITNITLHSNGRVSNKAKNGDVITIGFDVTDVQTLSSSNLYVIIAGGTVGSLVKKTGNHWSATYDVNKANNTSGNLVFTVSATDPLGNGNTASVIMKFDNEKPDITNMTLRSNGHISNKAKNGDHITIGFDVTDGQALKASNLQVTTTGQNTVQNIRKGSGDHWSATYAVQEGDNTSGILTFTVTATDAVGNVNTASADTGYDNKKPDMSNITLSSNGLITNKAQNGDHITIGFDATDEQALTASNLKVTTTGQDTVQNIRKGSGDHWSATYVVREANNASGTLIFTVTATDAVGNENVLSSSMVFDNKKPDITSLKLISSRALSNNVTNNDVITIGFDVTDAQALTASNLRVTTTGQNTVQNISRGTGDHWTATYTVQEANDTSGTLVFIVTATDPFNNESSVSESIVFDNKKPDLTIHSVSPSGSIVKNTKITVVFSAEDAISGRITDSSNITVKFDSIEATFDNTAYNSATNEWTVYYTPVSADVNGLRISVTVKDDVQNFKRKERLDITVITDS